MAEWPAAHAAIHLYEAEQHAFRGGRPTFQLLVILSAAKDLASKRKNLKEVVLVRREEIGEYGIAFTG